MREAAISVALQTYPALMRAFLVPHRLLAPKGLYVAALHCDDAVARAAFVTWLDRLNADAVPYLQHKVIGLIAARFEADIAAHRQGGVIQNIARQGRLRGHANLAILRKTLRHKAVAGLGLVAFGELREWLVSPPDLPRDCDVLELAGDRGGWTAAIGALTDAVWAIRSVRRMTLPGRTPVAILGQPASPLTLRLLGVGVAPADQTAFAGYPGLSGMTEAAHIGFMGSRRSCLLRRRDQFLFDIHRARQMAKAAGTDSTLTTRHLPWMFRPVGAEVLGDCP